MVVPLHAQLKEKGWQRGGLQRGREARHRAEQVSVATANRRPPELTVASADVGFASATPIDLDFGGPNGADGEAHPGLSQSWRNGMSQRQVSGSLDVQADTAAPGGPADASRPNREGGNDGDGPGNDKPGAGECFGGIHLPTGGSLWRLPSSPSPSPPPPEPPEDDHGGVDVVDCVGADDGPPANHEDTINGFIDDEYGDVCTGESSTPTPLMGMMGTATGLPTGAPTGALELGVRTGPGLHGPNGLHGGSDGADDLAAWASTDTAANGDADGGLHGPGAGLGNGSSYGLDDPIDDDPVELNAGLTDPFTEV